MWTIRTECSIDSGKGCSSMERHAVEGSTSTGAVRSGSDAIDEIRPCEGTQRIQQHMDAMRSWVASASASGSFSQAIGLIVSVARFDA
jgi:hypothetical protein